MALINKKVPITPQAKETATTDRTVLAEESSEMPKRKQHIKGVVPERFVLGAKDRKNIKVSEDDLDLIKSIAATISSDKILGLSRLFISYFISGSTYSITFDNAKSVIKIVPYAPAKNRAPKSRNLISDFMIISPLQFL